MPARLPRGALVLLTLAGLFAGCFSDAEETPARAADGAPTSAPSTASTGFADATGAPPSPDANASFSSVLRQFGCQTVFAYLDVDPTWAKSRMPRGYSPASFGSGAPAFGAKTWTCARSEIDGEAIEPGASLVYYLLVTPPAEHEGENVSVAWLPLGFVASSREEASFFGDAVMPTLDGSVDVEATTVPLATIGRSTSQGDVRLALETAGPASVPAEAYVARYFSVQNENVTGALDILVTEQLVSRGGYAHLAIYGPHVAMDARATGSNQFWAEDELSYEWRYRSLPQLPDTAAD